MTQVIVTGGLLAIREHVSTPYPYLTHSERETCEDIFEPCERMKKCRFNSSPVSVFTLT